ncbi:MAG: HAD family hydrolase [Cyanobacteriota bacterium]|nr:HAD family hydrolase [Cyanobacteriota bacterium]
MNNHNKYQYNQKLLILDIDETLIFSSEKQLDRLPDFKLDFGLEKYFVYTRPGLEEFISSCNNWFNLAVWTASSSDYAREVVKNIFPNNLKLAFIFTRERCVFRRNPELDIIETFKPVKKVKRKDFCLNNILIIDDTPETFKYNYGNAILVKQYQGEENDIELFLLLRYLEMIRWEENVRIIDKRHWESKIYFL